MGRRLDPAVARTRAAVRAALADLDPGDLVLVGCSGGADSLALLAGCCFEGPKAGLAVGAVVVDHGLQPGSAQVAAAAAATAQDLGADPVCVELVTVGSAGGPEGAARDARRAALDRVADGLAAKALLLGHTRDDQAETVLLGLARGSGARSLAGMRPAAGRVRRPLLDVTRDETAAACRALGLDWWDDPHNADPAHARARIRHTLLPALETGLGPGVRDALARTAGLLRADADALDALADELADSASLGAADGAADGAALRVDALAAAPEAVRRRVLRRAALAAGCPAGDLSAGHVAAADALVTGWHGQQGVDLPGHVHAWRDAGTVRMARRRVTG